MTNTLVIGGIIAVLLILSQVALSFGITTAVIVTPTALTEPSGGSFIDGFFTLAKWGFNAAGSIFQILTFQVQINPIANVLLFGPVVFMFFYIGWTAVRGGH